MSLCVVTINNLSPLLDRQHQEVQLIDRALTLAKADIRSKSGKKTSGNINGDGGVLLGTWTYTPQAGS
jgi:hypothetical protein